ncbi:MAG: class D sortase [Terriglobia bacterium]|nr:MAG: class D sortase [Terriglobia bacterium]
MIGVKRFASYLLIGAGAFLLFRGAQEYLESRWGQSAAGRQFETPEAPAVGEQGEPPSPPRDGETVAKLVIPRLETQLYVIEGDDTKDLRRGPGHLPGTAMPGGKGNCVIAGHRDTHFRVLKDIQKGDDIVLETRDGEFLYRVKSTQIVPPQNTEPIQPTHEAVLNLITCYPFYYVGNAPKRFIVKAELAGALEASLHAGGANTP